MEKCYENVYAAIQSHFYRLDIKCYVNLLPYRFYLHHESCICSLQPPPPLFSSLYLSDDTGYHHHPSSADIFQSCMYIKNFWWTEIGKEVLKIKEGRGGWFGWDKSRF